MINKLSLVVVIIAAGMFLFLLYSFILTNYWGLGYPYNAFLCSPEDNFMDFYNVNYFVNDFSPYSSNKHVSYPPFALLLAYPFSLFFQYTKYGSPAARDNFLAISSYVILFLSFSCFLLKIIYQSIKGNGKWKDIIYTIILFLTYPVFFLFDRGNYVMLTFIFLYLFVFYYYVHPSWSLCFLSAAIAMKVYPIFFILLLLNQRRWKDICKVTLMTGCFCIIPLFLFKNSFWENLTNFFANFFSFSGGYATEIANMSWNLSLMGVIKLPIMLFNQGTVPFSVVIPYLLLVVLVFCIVLFLLNKEMQLARKVNYLLVMQLLIMPISVDYNLIYMYIPFLLLLKKEKLDRDDFFTIIIIALLFVPKAYGVLFHERISFVTIQSFINPILLLSLIVYPFLKYVKSYLEKDCDRCELCNVWM